MPIRDEVGRSLGPADERTHGERPVQKVPEPHARSVLHWNNRKIVTIHPRQLVELGLSSHSERRQQQLDGPLTQRGAVVNFPVLVCRCCGDCVVDAQLLL